MTERKEENNLFIVAHSSDPKNKDIKPTIKEEPDSKENYSKVYPVEGKFVNPDDPKDEDLNLQNFLAKNGPQTMLLKQRDGTISWTKWIFAAIFVYLLVSPLFTMFQNAAGTAWVLVLLLLPIFGIIWSFIEYWARMESWFICICRGIILNTEKTHTAPNWLCTVPMYFVYSFMILVAILWAISYKPEGDDAFWKRYVGAALFLIGILFILPLTKAFVDLEGAPRTLSLNMFIFLLNDPKVLSGRGYKVIHYSQLANYFEKLRKDQNAKFSWNEVYKLSNETDSKGISKWNIVWGCKYAPILRKNKDLTS